MAKFPNFPQTSTHCMRGTPLPLLCRCHCYDIVLLVHLLPTLPHIPLTSKVSIVGLLEALSLCGFPFCLLALVWVFEEERRGEASRDSMVGLDWVENGEDSSCGGLCVIVSRGMNSVPFTSSTSMSRATAGTRCRQCVHDLHVCGYVWVHGCVCVCVWVCGCVSVWVCECVGMWGEEWQHASRMLGPTKHSCIWRVLILRAERNLISHQSEYNSPWALHVLQSHGLT